MADSNRARHAFGSSDRVAESIANGVIDSYDILFLDGDTDNPKIGWVSKDGKPVILRDEKADLTELETEIANIESAIATKANAEEVDAKIAAALDEHLVKKYEIADAPAGTIVDYGEKEIRVMCPSGSNWAKQNVGVGGDANCYYMTFKTYVPNDDVVGYIEHLGNQVDSEILTTFSTDEHGRRYQSTWLALAKYDEEMDAWTYYGKNSTVNKYIGWDYQIDWYNADGFMVASDSVRINLSNEDCHSEIKPYYVGGMVKEANDYTDAQIEAKIAELGVVYEIVEF